MFKSIVRVFPVVVLSAGLLAGCAGRSVPMRDARAVLLASPQQEPELRAAIARAMSAKSFTAESESPGTIVAQYNKGRVSLKVKITYTPTEYKVAYLDSDGLNYQTGPDGTPTISSRYDRIVRDLTGAIDDELGRPEREAKEAEDAHRRHELALAEADRQKQADLIEAKRRARAEAREAAALERERDRQAALEQERIRAEASRPVIVRRGGSRVVVEEPPPRVVVVQQSSSRLLAEPPPPPPPPAPTCRGTLLEQGHPSSSLMFCDGVEQRCAVALLRAGHNPAHLIHCRGVEPVCAETSLRRGQSPASLIHCR